MDEKRERPRFRIRQMIGYFPNREEYLWAEGLDMSIDGISCRSKAPVDPLTNLFVMISIPSPEGERLVRCEGYVAHSRMEEGSCRFGVKIERIPEEERPFVEAYLASLTEEESRPT